MNNNSSQDQGDADTGLLSGPIFPSISRSFLFTIDFRSKLCAPNLTLLFKICYWLGYTKIRQVMASDLRAIPKRAVLESLQHRLLGRIGVSFSQLMKSDRTQPQVTNRPRGFGEVE